MIKVGFSPTMTGGLLGAKAVGEKGPFRLDVGDAGNSTIGLDVSR